MQHFGVHSNEINQLLYGFNGPQKRQLKKLFLKLAKTRFKEGQEQSFEDEKAFIESFKILIEKLAAKATGTLEAIEAQYQEQFTEEPDTKIKGVLGRTMPAAPEYTQIEKAVQDTLRSVFFNAAFGSNTLDEQREDRTLLTDFLAACEDGILELGPLIDKKSGNILEEFRKTKYAKLEPFVNELLQKVPSGSGAGSWGPAELGLSIVGTPVKKADKGDLCLGDGRKIELKASRDPKSGARINTPAIGSGRSGESNYTKAWNKFTKDFGFSYKKTSRSRAVLYAHDFIKGKKLIPGHRSITFTNFGPTVINKVLNPAIILHDPTRNEIKEFLTDVALSSVLEEYKPLGRKLFRAAKVVKRNKTIDGAAFVAEYLHMLLSFYALTDEIEEIVIINPISGNYEVVDATDTDTLKDKLESGEIILGSTYIDFSDSQSKASPQLGIY